MEKQGESRVSLAFVTNYLDKTLLGMAESFIPSGYKIYKVPGDGGYYGQKLFMDFCNRIDEDYVVYMDTDCFITNHSAMWALIREFISCNYTLCGMPDGGVISHRCHNPLFINPFFSIWNLKRMREMNLTIVNDVTDSVRFREKAPRWTFNRFRSGSVEHYPRLDIVMSDGLIPFGFSNDFFEPYYAIQSAILNNGGKILYLDAVDAPEIDGDGACTALCGLGDEKIALHSWFARSYNDADKKHFNRINKIYDYARKNCNINVKRDSKEKGGC